MTLNKLNYNYEKKEISPGDIAAYLINADILIRMEKYNEAMQKTNLLKELSKRFLPNEHSLYKANIMSYHSYLSALLENNLEQNIETLISSQDTLKKLLGKENYYKNCNVYLGHKFLGELYEKQENNLKAKQEYSIGLEILTNTYNNMANIESDDLSDFYYKLAIINLKLGLTSRAIDYITNHFQIFGFDHPRSIKITDYIVNNDIELGF
jgi:tetratricopeptide (TPR) repeat protein